MMICVCSRRSARRFAAAAVLVAAFLVPAAARAGLPEHPAVSQGPPPPWVEPAGDLRPAPDGASGLAYRLLEDQVRVDGDRTTVYTVEVAEVVSQQGLDGGARWEVGFDPAAQRVRVQALEVLRDGTWYDRLATARGSVLQREASLERRIYDESLTLLLLAEDVRVGDVVRFAYTVEGFNPVMGDRYVGSFTLGWWIPVAERRLRVLVPPGRRVHHRLHGGERLGSDDLQPVERRTADGLELTWHQDGVAALEAESFVPDGWVTWPYVQLSEFADWAEVVEWGRPLYAAPEPPPEVRRVAGRIAAESLVTGHPEVEAARATAAVRWVQDEVRYFAVAIGLHSHTPHRLEEIVRRRYGDCKDKVRLLVALLGELGVEAWPALVHSSRGRGLDRWRPSPGAFDHAVVVARVDGEEVWIDPTLELQGGGVDDLWFPRYERALELRPGTDALTVVPAEQGHPGVTTVRYDYRVSDVGEPLEATIETVWERSGAERLRRTLDGTTPDDLQDDYVDFYTDGERTVVPLEPLEIIDDRDANRLSIVERYRVEGCWQPRDGGVQCDLLPLLMDAELPQPDGDERSAPVSLPRDLHTREIVTLRADPSWEFEAVESTEQNRWFEASIASEPEPGGIELVYDLRTVAPVVEPEDVGVYAAAVREMREGLGYSLYQTAVEAEGVSEEQEAPLEVLQFAVGCIVLSFIPIGVLGGIVLLVVFVRAYRRRKAVEAAIAAAPPAVPPRPAPRAPGAPRAAGCPHCGATPEPGARFCSACGANLADP